MRHEQRPEGNERETFEHLEKLARQRKWSVQNSWDRNMLVILGVTAKRPIWQGQGHREKRNRKREREIRRRRDQNGIRKQIMKALNASGRVSSFTMGAVGSGFR